MNSDSKPINAPKKQTEQPLLGSRGYPKRKIVSCTRCQTPECQQRKRFGFCIVTAFQDKNRSSAGNIAELEYIERQRTQEWINFELTIGGAIQ